MSTAPVWTTEDEIQNLDINDKLCEDAPVDVAALLASRVLFELTGATWTGAQAATVRPCARYPEGQYPAWPPTVTPPSLGGSVFGAGLPEIGWWTWQRSWGICTCGLGRLCTCCCTDRVTLGAYPIIAVTSVWCDGVELEEGVDWRLVEHRWLERAQGDTWPSCQDLWSARDEVDTFEVSFTWGQAVPEDGGLIAALYGLEIAKSMCGMECDLPTRVTSITRQGTTVTLADPMQLAEKGLTGVPIVDTWIRAMTGGKKPTQPARMYSPDAQRHVEYRDGASGGGS